MFKRLLVIAAATVAAALIGGAQASADTVTLRFDSWVPKHFINTELLPAWTKQVEEATGGRVKIDIGFPPGAPPPSMFERVKDGVADLAWGLHGYTPGRFELTELAELPFLDAPSSVVSVAYWRAYEKYLAKLDEHQGTTLVGLSVATPGVLHTKFPVNALEDLKGKKFRVPGGIAALIAERLGIVGVQAPAPKVYEMLQQGVIDGVFMPPETSNSFKLKEVTKYMNFVPGGLYFTSFFIVANPNALAKLSDQDRAAFMRVSGENLARLWGRIWDDQDPPAMKAAEALGVKIGTVGPEVSKRIHDLLADLDDAWVAKANKKGVDGAAALAFFKSEIGKLKGK